MLISTRMHVYTYTRWNSGHRAYVRIVMCMFMYNQTMYKPNPFLLSTLYAWIEGALQIHRNSHGGHEGHGGPPDPHTIMKLIHREHPGALFSPSWFRVKYTKYMNTIRRRPHQPPTTTTTAKTPHDDAVATNEEQQPG